MAPVRKGQPLALRPLGSKPIGPAVALLESDDGGVVSIWGMVSSCWEADDVTGRRLAAVTLMQTKAATRAEIRAGFEINDDTLRRWDHQFDAEGVVGLVPDRRGPRGPFKLTGELAVQIRALRAEGVSLLAVA